MLLNVVNTTGEYLIARLLTAQVSAAGARESRVQQAGVHRRVQRRLPVLGQRRGLRPPGVRDVAARQAHRFAGCAAGPAADCARRLRGRRRRRRVLGRALDQDRRERDRLLDHEHRASAALAADQPRGKVQGEAGDRHVLRARRRSAFGGRGVSRRQRPAPDGAAVRPGQHRPHAGLDRRGADDSRTGTRDIDAVPAARARGCSGAGSARARHSGAGADRARRRTGGAAGRESRTAASV